MKFLPLWIAKFLPMNSGTIVQARAQVLIGSRLPDWSALYTFSSSRSTTYGPFFSERPMSVGFQGPAGLRPIASRGGARLLRGCRFGSVRFASISDGLPRFETA